MFYEIYFEPAVGKWRIRVSTVRLGIFVCYEDVRGDEGSVMGFASHAEAATHVTSIGLHNVYDLKTRKGLTQAVHALTHSPA